MGVGTVIKQSFFGHGVSRFWLMLLGVLIFLLQASMVEAGEYCGSTSNRFYCDWQCCSTQCCGGPNDDDDKPNLEHSGIGSYIGLVFGVFIFIFVISCVVCCCVAACPLYGYRNRRGWVHQGPVVTTIPMQGTQFVTTPAQPGVIASGPAPDLRPNNQGYPQQIQQQTAYAPPSYAPATAPPPAYSTLSGPTSNFPDSATTVSSPYETIGDTSKSTYMS